MCANMAILSAFLSVSVQANTYIRIIFVPDCAARIVTNTLRKRSPRQHTRKIPLRATAERTDGSESAIKSSFFRRSGVSITYARKLRALLGKRADIKKFTLCHTLTGALSSEMIYRRHRIFLRGSLPIRIMAEFWWSLSVVKTIVWKIFSAVCNFLIRRGFVPCARRTRAMR